MPGLLTEGISGTDISFKTATSPSFCDEDNYFMELVRYIHLNPLRAGLVKNTRDLDKYRWCGHSELIGRRRHNWHHADDVLVWFGASVGAARRAYKDYVEEGASMGRRPDLVGGGLIRSQGGSGECHLHAKKKSSRAC